jgi:hypothetical protein
MLSYNRPRPIEEVIENEKAFLQFYPSRLVSTDVISLLGALAALSSTDL